MTNDNDARGALTEIAKAAWDEAWRLAFDDGLSAGHPLGRSRLDRETEWADSEVVARIAKLPAGDGLTDEVWPIVNVTVGEDGQISAAKLYAPGLPPGNHDVYPVRVPYMDEHTEAWMAVAKALEEVAPGYLDGSGNGIECAVAAIHRLSASRQPGEMVAGVQQEIQLLEQIAACGDTWDKQALLKQLDNLQKPAASAQQDEREALLNSFDAAYMKAAQTSQPSDWHEAALLGRQWRNSVVEARAAQQVQADFDERSAVWKITNPENGCVWFTEAKDQALQQAREGKAVQGFGAPTQVQADAWQPIETAPKDGTRILLKSPKGRIADGDWGQYGVWSWPYVMVEPTHWMPLNAIQQVQADAGAVALLKELIDAHSEICDHTPESFGKRITRIAVAAHALLAAMSRDMENVNG